MPSGKWALARGARPTWARFREGWRELPAAAWRRWALTLVLGFVASASLIAAVTLVARGRAHTLNRWDEHRLRRVEAGPMSFSNAILLESFGNLAYLVPVTAAAMVWAARRGRPLLALSFPIAYLLQRPLVLLGWQLWDRQRPKLIADGIAAPGLHSFPSGHAALTLAVYGLLAYLWFRASRSGLERALVVVLLAALLGSTGWARIRLGAHWPSDVLAGWAIGAAWCATVIFALRRAERAGGC